MNTRKKTIGILDVCAVIFIVIGMIFMFYNAVNGNRYRYFYVSEFRTIKALVGLCTVLEWARIMYRLLGTKKNAVKYSAALISYVLLAVVVFVVNNILHYVGFVAESGINNVNLGYFIIADLKYLNGAGIIRYVLLAAIGMVVFFVLDKGVMGRLGDIIAGYGEKIMKKFNLSKMFGIEIIEEYEDETDKE